MLQLLVVPSLGLETVWSGLRETPRRASFDLFVLGAVLGEIPNPEAALREVRRVLRPDGVLSITEVRGEPDRLPFSSLRGLVQRSGCSFAKRLGGGWRYAANLLNRGWIHPRTSIARRYRHLQIRK